MAEDSFSVDGLFKMAAKGLKDEFEKIRATMPHYGTAGSENEGLLIKFLSDHMPRRFAATSGFVVDTDNSVSKQCDVLVYDAENSPVYRVGPTTQILPSDGIASVIEVKSTLDKAELEDAAVKIASVKKLKRSPISNLDQPVNFSNFIVNNSLGVVFAYKSRTSLETLAMNLKEINKKLPRAHWIDAVVVLEQGMIGYSIGFPGEKNFRGIMMPEASEDFRIPACYVHLCLFEDPEYALHRFFVNLMSVLTFYRKRTILPLESLLKGSENVVKNIQGYWYTTDRNLVEVPDTQIGKGEEPLFVFDVFYKNTRMMVGRFSQCKWSDGYIYQVIPPNEDAFVVLGLIINAAGQRNCSAVRTPDGLIAHTCLLKGNPPTLDVIKEVVSKRGFDIR